MSERMKHSSIETVYEVTIEQTKPTLIINNKRYGLPTYQDRLSTNNVIIYKI